MSSLEKIDNKITTVRKYLDKLKKYKKYSLEEILADETITAAVERFLYLTAESTINLAESVIAYREFRKPTILKEAFEILEENELIDHELTGKMKGMVGFRNIIAHDYDKIKYDIVYDVLQNKSKDVEEFVRIIEQKL